MALAKAIPMILHTYLFLRVNFFANCLECGPEIFSRIVIFAVPEGQICNVLFSAHSV